MKTFVIHLERATARRAQVDQLLRDAPFPAEVFPAIEGVKVANPPIAPRYSPRYPFAMGGGEIGCFLSHRAIWQKLTQSGDDAALILEDDVALDPGFNEAATFAAAHVAELEYIQFQTRPVKGFAEVVVSQSGQSIVAATVTPLRTSAQMISSDAASRLIAASDAFDRPVDAFLQMHWETGVRVHTSVPSCVSDRTQETGGSTISGPKRGLWDEAKRSWHRSAYRRAIARLSRQQ